MVLNESHKKILKALQEQESITICDIYNSFYDISNLWDIIKELYDNKLVCKHKDVKTEIISVEISEKGRKVQLDV